MRELFTVETPKRRFNANAVKFGGVHPYVVRTSQNNGRRGKIIADDKWLSAGNTMSFGQDTATIFYQEVPYFTGDKIKVLSPIFGTLNERVACYLLTSMRKAFSNFRWGTSSFDEKVLKSVEIQLPVVNFNSRQIDLAYMEDFIRELEVVRIRELDKWLKATGLNDCRLTANEQKALKGWSDGVVKTAIKKVTEVFDVANTHCVLAERVSGRSGKVPYVTASSCNNSVSSYIDYKDEFLDRGNAIVIGGKTFVVTYQSEDFFSNDSHNLVLRLKDERHRNRDVYLYLIAAINAAMGSKYSWGDSISYKKIQGDEIAVPVNASGEVDYDFMADFIRAAIKWTIRGVVRWKDGRESQIHHLLSEIGEALKFREYLPVYSFNAACGPLAEGQEAEIEGWIKVEGHGKLDPTQFVIRTEGVSMEGLIPDGTMCIMRKLGGGGLEGKTILVQRNDASDPESGGAYTIKTFTRKGKAVVLKAKDPKYDIPLEDGAEYSQQYRAIAEFKGVL